jgi:hypothetical protein
VPAHGSRWHPCALALASLAGALACSGQADAQTVTPPGMAQVYAAGNVYTIVRQPDNKVIIGGAFDHVNGVARSNIARLNSDGSLDLVWNPGADYDVNALALNAAGDVYVGGLFKHAGGQPRRGLAKLAGTGSGTADPNWDPNPVSAYEPRIYSLAVDAGGNVFVGGFFTAVGGQPRNFIAKLAGTGAGAADPVWNPNLLSRGIAKPGVRSIVLDGIGSLFVAGAVGVNGGPSLLLKLSSTGAGTVDASWNPAPYRPCNGSVANCADVDVLVLDAAHNVFVGGWFGSIGGQTRICLAKLSPTGSGAADAQWNPYTDGEVLGLSVDGLGNAYAGGVFQHVTGVAISGLAKVSATGAGAVDANWKPVNFVGEYTLGVTGIFDSSPIYALANDVAGNVLAGGGFSRIGGQTKTAFAVLSPSAPGGASPAWASAMVPGVVAALVRDANNRTVIGGTFSFMGDGVTVRDNIARLNADGSLDGSWHPDANDKIAALALDGAGNVYAGGKFTVIGGQARNRLAKLSGSGAGAADAGWNADVDGKVSAIAVDVGGVYAGGTFSHVGGQARNNIAKMSPGTGAVDPVWNPNATPDPTQHLPTVGVLALDGAGSLYVGGEFVTIGGQSRHGLARLSASGAGAADAVWNPDPRYYVGVANGGRVDALALDTGGHVYVGGGFALIGGQVRSGLARVAVSGAGAADPAFHPDPAGVSAIALDGVGNLYIGGSYAYAGGAARRSLAKLSNAGNADCQWIADLDSVGLALAVDAGGTVYAGGDFSRVNDTPSYGFARIVPGGTPQCQLSFSDINGGVPPSAAVGFNLRITARDAHGNPQSVVAATTAGLSLHSGSGTLGGTPSCQIAPGLDSCTATGVTYSTAQSGVSLTATATSGDADLPGNSAPFTVIPGAPPTRIAFLAVNGGNSPTAGVGFDVVLQTQDASGAPQNVAVSTPIGLHVAAGTGRLFGVGQNYASGCTLAAGANTCTMSALVYTKAETGVVLGAAAITATARWRAPARPSRCSSRRARAA